MAESTAVRAGPSGWKKLAFSLITVLAVLGGFEGYCRYRESPPVFRTSPVTGYELVPGARTRRESINSEGYRGPERPAARPAGVLRILCMGGSTTWGHNLRDGETWPHLLEQRLVKDLGPPVEVWNGGVQGWGFEHIAASLESGRLARLQPDVVVLYEGWNDPRIDSEFTLNTAKKISGAGASGAVYNLAMARWFARRVQRAREKASFSPFQIDASKAGEEHEALLGRMRDHAPAAISRTAALCRAQGAALVMVEIPGLVQAPVPAPDAPWYAKYEGVLRAWRGDGPKIEEIYAVHARYRTEAIAVLRAAAHASGVPFLPLASRMAEKAGGASDRPPDGATWTSYFRDHEHFTPKGDEALAEALQELLAERGMLTPRSR